MIDTGVAVWTTRFSRNPAPASAGRPHRSRRPPGGPPRRGPAGPLASSPGMPSFTATWIACAVQAPVSRYITLSPPGSEDDSAVAGLPGRVDRADQRQRQDPRSLLGQAVSRGSPELGTTQPCALPAQTGLSHESRGVKYPGLGKLSNSREGAAMITATAADSCELTEDEYRN